MKAMLIPVGEMPRMVEIDGLEGLQQAVGGHIDACGWMFDDAPTIYVNDDGKFSCAPNRAIYATAEDDGKQSWHGTVREGDLLDIVFGDFVAVGFDPMTGEDRDITEKECEKVLARFGTQRSIDSGILETLAVKMGLK